MRWLTAIAVFIFSVVVHLSFAFAGKGGTLDPTFGNGGVRTATFPPPAYAAAVAIQPDGRIVAVGHSETGSASTFAVARFVALGTLDPSFGTGGQVRTQVGVDVGAAVVLQVDGGIVVAGTSFTAPGGGVGRVMLVRYDATGALDATFGTSGVVITPPVTDAEVTAMALQPDGRFVVVGRDADAFMLRRYEADGAVDVTFGSGGLVTTAIGTSAHPFAVVLEPGGRIVVAGTATAAPGDDDFALVRYEGDGSLDGTFGSGGVVTTSLGNPVDAAKALVRDPSGRLVAAGYTGGNPHFALARYDGAGALDPSFGSGGIVVDASVFGRAKGLTLQPDGKLVAAGLEIVPIGPILVGRARVTRYNDTGAFDASFGTNGGTSSQWDDYSEVLAVALQADGRIVVGGLVADLSPSFVFTNLRMTVARYLAGTCGDANQEAGEQCDDGNVVAGDCCTPTCDLDPVGTACDDGQSDLCTAPDACDGAGSCVTGGPVQCPPCEACDLVNGCVANIRPVCKAPVKAGAARLKLTNATSTAKDRLQWKWSSGAATAIGDFGDPDATDDLAFCVFDGTSQLAMSAAVPAGGVCGSKPCWKSVSKGFRYNDRYGTPDGITGALLKAGADGKAKVSVDGKGEYLALPDLVTLSLPLRVQLQAENSQCWEATYSSTGVSQNDGEHFKARSD